MPKKARAGARREDITRAQHTSKSMSVVVGFFERLSHFSFSCGELGGREQQQRQQLQLWPLSSPGSRRQLVWQHILPCREVQTPDSFQPWRRSPHKEMPARHSCWIPGDYIKCASSGSPVPSEVGLRAKGSQLAATSVSLLLPRISLEGLDCRGLSKLGDLKDF